MPHPASLQELLKHRRVLLLQGPMGTFFSKLARFLTRSGARVYKVNFNGGDELFYRGPSAISYRGRHDDWSAWLDSLLTVKRIDAIVLFGQNRPVHKLAREVARLRKVPVFVFEEGYIRPDYVTLERGGVNGYSALPRERAFYEACPDEPAGRPAPTGQTFWRTALVAMAYCVAMVVAQPWYRGHVYHRSMHPVRQGLCWVRSGWRKLAYGWRQRHVLDELTSPQRSKRWFLLPLQVHNDSQIVHHSPFDDVHHVIRHVMTSFAQHAPAGHALVIKHHPMDRAYVDYTGFIDTLARELGLSSRVHYVHDLHLPTLLKHTRGVVTVNSTTGLQAMAHHAPVIALGDCFYAVPGMVHAGPLSRFWTEPGEVNETLFRQFKAYLVRHTQVNASFYARSPALDRLPLQLADEADATAPDFAGSMPSQPLFADELPGGLQIQPQPPAAAAALGVPAAAMNDAGFVPALHAAPGPGHAPASHPRA
jgi:capsular polysaccharide export protein